MTLKVLWFLDGYSFSTLLFASSLLTLHPYYISSVERDMFAFMNHLFSLSLASTAVYGWLAADAGICENDRTSLSCGDVDG